MQFLSPWMLSGFAALAVPVIIHLWRRRKVVRIQFSTLRLLKKVASRTRRRSRLENLALLLLRCLVFALVILAVAQPVSTRNAIGFGGSVPRIIVLAVDTSASMSSRDAVESRLEAAKRCGQAILEKLKPEDSVALLSVNRTVQKVIAEPTVDHAAVREALNQLQPGETHGDFSTAFLEARAIFDKSKAGNRELYLLTDSQRSAWRFDATPVFNESWKDLKVHTVVVRPDNATPRNAAIREVQIVTPFVTAGEMVQGVAAIENFSEAPLNDLLEITMDGTRVLQKPVELGPGASASVPFEFQAPELPGGVARGIASIEGDSFSLDDKFYFLAPVQRAPLVLVAEGQWMANDRFTPGFFLRKALQAGSGSPVARVDAASLEETALESFSAVFLLDFPALNDRSLVRLDRFLRGGGTLICFPGEQTTIESLAKAEFLPATASGIIDLPLGRIATEVLEPGHPLFANVWTSETPFPAVPQKKAIDWQPKGSARVLAKIAGKYPFIVEGDYEGGRVFLVNASADRSWGDLPLSPAFLPLVQQLARLSSERAGARGGLLAGDEVLPGPVLEGAESPTLELPRGEVQPLTQEKVFANTPGFYFLRDSRAGGETIAVNVDRKESDLSAAPDEEVRGISGAETIAGLDELRSWLARSRGLIPIWPLVLIAALLLFAAEEILANWMARHRAQGAEDQIRTGRLNKRRIGVTFRPAETEVAP